MEARDGCSAKSVSNILVQIRYPCCVMRDERDDVVSLRNRVFPYRESFFSVRFGRKGGKGISNPSHTLTCFMAGAVLLTIRIVSSLSTSSIVALLLAEPIHSASSAFFDKKKKIRSAASRKRSQKELYFGRGGRRPSRKANMVEQKKRRREGTDTDQGEVKALRQENERLRQENERLREERAKPREEVEELKLRVAKLETGCQTPQEKDKEVKLPTEVWAIIAAKLEENDVCCFALVSKQLREAQVLAGRELVTRPYYWGVGGLNVASFTEDWCAYWSRKFIEDHTHPKVVKRVLYVAARCGYLQVFEKYWSQGPQEKLSKLWDEDTCSWAAFRGHLEVIKWLRAKGCPWGKVTSYRAADGGHLEVLQWMQAQDPPCPWDEDVFLTLLVMVTWRSCAM